MNDADLQKKLQEIGAKLKKATPGTAAYQKLMRELDRLLDAGEGSRDTAAEEEWEQNRR